MMSRLLVLAFGMLLAATAAPAEDLKAVYERALANDPQIREADALRRAARESSRYWILAFARSSFCICSTRRRSSSCWICGRT